MFGALIVATSIAYAPTANLADADNPAIAADAVVLDMFYA